MVKKLSLWALGIILISGLIGINGLAFRQSYLLSNYFRNTLDFPTLEEFGALSFSKKIFSSYRLPKNKVIARPSISFYTNQIESRRFYFYLDYWVLPSTQPKGVVLFFHDFLNVKTSLITAAEHFQSQGYTSVLVDFSGYGRSKGGRYTTLGCKESWDVVEVFQEMKETFPGLPIVLYGNEMGSVAILKAIHDYQIQPDAIIINSPFESPLSLVRNRLEIVGIPTFPAAELLVFWGSFHHKTWGFTHNSTSYAQKVAIPTLVMHGAENQTVKTQEVEQIYATLIGDKELKFFDKAKSWAFEKEAFKEWDEATSTFLSRHVLQK